MEFYREISRAIALGDLAAANMALTIRARDNSDISHQIDLGRSDAVAAQSRSVKPRLAKAA